jgi:hypothetical protein
MKDQLRTPALYLRSSPDSRLGGIQKRYGGGWRNKNLSLSGNEKRRSRTKTIILLTVLSRPMLNNLDCKYSKNSSFCKFLGNWATRMATFTSSVQLHRDTTQNSRRHYSAGENSNQVSRGPVGWILKCSFPDSIHSLHPLFDSSSSRAI